MEELKNQIISEMKEVMYILDKTPLVQHEKRTSYLRELDAFAKIYSTLEGNNVTLQNRKLT